MSVHRYPLTALIGDYSRSAAGIAVSLVPFAVAPSRPLVTWLFGGLLIVFVLYALRTAVRHFTHVHLADEGIAATLPARRVAWQDLEGMRLRYYATRRNRAKGAFELVVAGAGRRIVVDSSISGFHVIAGRAAAAAERRGLALDETTRDNLAALIGTAKAAG